MIATGNPCPICRDEFLILDYRNVDLLKQFISPYSGKLLSYKYVSQFWVSIWYETIGI